MIPAPHTAALNPRYRPLLDALQGTLTTAEVVSKRWCLSISHLSNLRRAGKGPAWVKLTTGAVRYPVSEVLAVEIDGMRGPVTLDRIALALAALPDLDWRLREKIETHLAATVFAPCNTK